MVEDVRGAQQPLDAARMRQMLEHLPYFAVMIDRARRFVWVNRLDSTLDLSQVIGRRVDEFIHEEAAKVAVVAIERAFSEGVVVSYEARAYGEGEMETWYGSTVVPLPLDARGEQHALLLSVDVSERHRAERALRESERRFRRLTEASPDFIAIIDRDQVVRYLNRDASMHTGYPPDEVVGRRLTELVAPDDVERVRSTAEHVLVHQEPGACEARPLASESVFEVRVTPLQTQAGVQQALVIATDVTERRREAAQRAALEAQLRQAQKLETVGQLAGGVAHDFNNLLTVIQSGLEFAMDAIKAGTDPSADLLSIGAAADRASDMTRRLLTIGRRQPHQPITFDLGALSRETMALLGRMIPESIAVELQVSDERLHVWADRAELEQVLINLCVNARDAIDGIGKIRVTVAGVAAPKGPTDRWVALSVADTGCGMSESVASHLFEPFFTTKPAGRGTGLGLSMAHAIVSSYGGLLRVETAEGRGTTMTVLLPSADGPSDVLERQASVELAQCASRGEILVAEDEPSVRQIAVRTLAQAGFDVLEASNGREAVELFARNAEKIRLVLIDAIMPVLGGVDAYEEMRRIHPNVRVLFASGYAPDLATSEHAVPALRFLHKPYGPAALLSAVREALDA